MLTIDVGGQEGFDEETQEFTRMSTTTLSFEHSLVAISKWESKWEKPFLGPDKKTTEETDSYVRFMCLSELPDALLAQFTKQDYDAISRYIDRKMTATWFNEPPSTGRGSEVITAEIVYYWLVALNIPFECQYWHLNRLLTLVKVINEKNKPADQRKKTPMRDLAAQRRLLNQQRRAQMHTTG